MNKYLLIDFMNMAFRAHYAYAAQQEFTNAEGIPTGMTYGLLSMTLSLIKDVKPTHVAFATESRSRTLNADLVERERVKPSVEAAFPSGYKGSRKEMDPLLRAQLDLAEEACREMGWPVYRSEGYEADDTLASLARIIEKQGDTAVIVTGDQDLWQCITDAVSVYKPQPRGVYLEVTPKTIEILTGGFRADQIVEYKAIIGDSSDGYPGCPGIGPKGALALLTEFGSVDQVYANIVNVKGATQKKLIDNVDLVQLSRKLAQLDAYASVDFDSLSGKLQWPYPDSAAAFIRKHDMASLERRIGHETFPEETHDAFPL